jgi:hypothetical protein
VVRLEIWAIVGTLVVGVAPPPVPAAGPSVVVNEFADGAYVELLNVSRSTVDIGGFELWLCGAHGLSGEVRIALDRPLFSGDFYVVASSSFTGGTADQIVAGALAGTGVVLRDHEHGWVDGVAVVAESPCGEGDPAPACRNASTARDPAGTDTGRNDADFSCRWRSPGGPN